MLQESCNKNGMMATDHTSHLLQWMISVGWYPCTLQLTNCHQKRQLANSTGVISSCLFLSASSYNPYYALHAIPLVPMTFVCLIISTHRGTIINCSPVRWFSQEEQPIHTRWCMLKCVGELHGPKEINSLKVVWDGVISCHLVDH